jgi:hypothetical protein
MDRKMKELLALRQGSDTVYEYAKKLNAFCQYGGHYVDNDAKKIERFRDGLHGDLYERLNLYEPNSYRDLVSVSDDFFLKIKQGKFLDGHITYQSHMSISMHKSSTYACL